MSRFNLRYQSTWSNVETTCVLVHVFIALLRHDARGVARGKVKERVRVRRAGSMREKNSCQRRIQTQLYYPHPTQNTSSLSSALSIF